MMAFTLIPVLVPFLFYVYIPGRSQGRIQDFGKGGGGGAGNC